eukprot:TRINITY_DN2123_c0_g1_i1.p1 TRINITY_DN2123_c0_g1~~TRINITY_DN2123_c0_g1_i1.p1  ORF type:complete len:205 (-),score=48.57 TRINITY_DN2123_c0_g1_i1:248-862(-)
MSSNSFNLKGSSEFSGRVQDTFKDLLAPTANNSINKDDDSSFTRPTSPPRRSSSSTYTSNRRRASHHPRHKVPGWRKDPSKYTKYDLSDVEVSSDKGNTRAAFSFLQDIRKRSLDEEQAPPDLSQASFSFKKPRIKQNNKEDDICSSISSGPSKRILPEAVVGEKPVAKEKKSLRTTTLDKKASSKATLTLSHLEDEVEDDNDD